MITESIFSVSFPFFSLSFATACHSGIVAKSAPRLIASVAASESQNIDKRVLRPFLLVSRPPEANDFQTVLLEELQSVVAKPGMGVLRACPARRDKCEAQSSANPLPAKGWAQRSAPRVGRAARRGPDSVR